MPTFLKIANAALLCLNQSGQLATLASFMSELSTDSRATQFRFLNALSGQAPIIWQNAYRISLGNINLPGFFFTGQSS